MSLLRIHPGDPGRKSISIEIGPRGGAALAGVLLACGASVVLGLAGTALAQILSYRMIAIFGSSRSVLVAYTLPGFALLYGAVFLSEPISLQKLAGLLLISCGVGLGSGVWRIARRAPIVEAP